MTVIDIKTAGSQNVLAFLDMIAVSEIGRPMLAISDDGYNVLVGSTPDKMLTFSGYQNHPNILNAKLKSTAAGRYQILWRWWKPYKKQLGLPDFSPLSQDRYAIQQLKEQGAIPLIESGQIEKAIEKVSNIWASFPGAGYGQPEHQITHLLDAYRAAGGTVSL